MDLKYFYTSLMAALVGLASAFQGEISIAGDNEIGGNVTITCSWTLSQNEAFVNVILRSLPVPSGDKPYYYQFTNGVPFGSVGSQSNNRISADSFNVSSQRAVVRITNVQCADDRNYSCLFTYAVPSSGMSSYEKTSYLTVKARPKAPTVRLLPNTNSDLLESSNISVVCASNIGLSGRGSLQWKIYRSGRVPEVVQATDSRLSALNNASLEAGEGSCTQRVQQTFSMIVKRDDQNLTIACFVQNDDFQNQVPDMCQDTATDLCAKTQPLRIVYGVNETDMSVNSDPPGEVYQDKAITLTCTAEGLPAPVYTWVRVLSDNSTDTDNNTSPGRLVDDKSQLVLSNLVSYGGQELKYACTATNTVLGRTYSVTKEITIQVLMTTTTQRTTTTTTTPTTPTTLGGSQSPNGTSAQSGGDDDKTKTIIIVVVVVGSILIIALIVGIILWRRRQSKKQIEEPSEKPYNNRTNLSYQHSQPDLVADKKFTSPSLDNSFTEKKEDGLMCADLTYDNKPRSRKPMAIHDTSSEYSDIQMPQV